MVSLSAHRDTVACSYLSTAYQIKQRAISHSQLPCYSGFTDLTLVFKARLSHSVLICLNNRPCNIRDAIIYFSTFNIWTIPALAGAVKVVLAIKDEAVSRPKTNNDDKKKIMNLYSAAIRLWISEKRPNKPLKTSSSSAALPVSASVSSLPLLRSWKYWRK